VDSGSGNHIYNVFESFDSIKSLDESIRIANGSFIRIIRQGSVKLSYKHPNRTFPFLLLLENVYFISECTVNLVSTSQLSIDSIVFNSEVPCLKAFSSTEALCSISQNNRHYILNATLRPESAFIESIDLIYLILSPLEHSLLLWHRWLGHTSLEKICQAIKTTEEIDLNIPTIKRLPFCETYTFDKSQKTISQSLQKHTDRPGQKLHIDLVELINPVRIENVHWFLASVDDYCRWRRVQILKQKANAEEALYGMVNWAETQWNTKVQTIQLDRG
jgi:hypothetical protein